MGQFLLSALVGTGAAGVAIALAQFEPRFVAAGLIALFGAFGLLILGTGRRTSVALVFVLGLTIPVNVTTTLLYYPQAPDQHVPHMTTASGITITVPLLAAFAIFLIQAFVSPERRILRRLQLEPFSASGAGLLFVAGLLSLINAWDWWLTQLELIRIALLFLFTLLISNLDRSGIDAYLRALAVAMILQGALGAAQFAASTTFGVEKLLNAQAQKEFIDFVVTVRGTGTVGGPNALAYFFEILLPMMLALALVETRPRVRLLYGLAVCVGLAGDLATLSRASWIALPIPLAIVAFRFVGPWIWSMRGALVGVGAMIAVAGSLVVVGPIIVKRFTADDAGSADTRGPLNRSTLSMVEQFPVFGVGLNNFADSFARYDRVGGERLFRGGNAVVHNMYLLVLGEIGFVGFAAFLWYVATPFVLGALVWRRSVDPLDRAIALGAPLGLLAHLVHATYDPGFRLNTLTAIEVACQIGLLAALYLRTAPAPTPAVRRHYPPLVAGRETA